MKLLFNFKGESRKQMVQAIEEELGVKAKYLGVPSLSYEIGDYTVGRNGELECSNEVDKSLTSKVVQACILATGFIPEGWEDTSEEIREGAQDEKLGLTVGVPLEKVKLSNLRPLIDSKAGLIKKALSISDLSLKVDEEKVSFPWFSNDLDFETIQTYTKFISALCEMSLKQRRIQAKEKEVQNEKYAFRCFLLRLGFIGNEYKVDRKILLSKLEGSSAFRNAQRGGGE